MGKAYWVTCYRSIRDAAALQAYARLAGPAIEGHGGRFLARGPAARWFEAGTGERVVLIEFASLEAAATCHGSPEYQAALAVLGDAAERDMRFIEGT
jgi:uncharacterized protein (DUF1330 family)